MDNEGCYVFTNLPLILFRIGIIKIPILKKKFPKNTNSFFHHSYSLRNTMKGEIHISSSYLYIPLTKTYDGKSSSPYFFPPISLSFPQTEPNKVKTRADIPQKIRKKR